LALALALALLSACVPADESLPTGSAEFTILTPPTDNVFRDIEFADYYSSDQRAWDVAVDRTLLSFKTITIGAIGVPDKCAYRGRGARSNVVFDPALGNVQSFNGILPGLCPDVGIVLGAPDASTFLADGVTTADAAALLAPPAAHVIVTATATPSARGRRDTAAYKLVLRFDDRAGTTWGGCRDDGVRGVRIEPEARQSALMRFRPEALFREAISATAQLRFQPLADADEQGNRDQVITMVELDAVPLSTVRRRYSSFYVLPDGKTGGTLGDFVRAQLRFVFTYGERGLCSGNPPGVQ